MTHSRTPDLMPLLSRGKHRNPRKGACFMELASFLAGERWSDHPDCTHALLAALARDVNDHVGSDARSRLAGLIPGVIGLNSDDPRVEPWIAREAALTALPITAAERQGVSAVGVVRCERVLNELEGRSTHYLSERTAKALDDVPSARDWARNFSAVGWGNPGSFARRSAPAIVHSSVSGISVAAVSDSDGVLVDLLAGTIERCRSWFAHEAAPVGEDRWRAVCELTSR